MASFTGTFSSAGDLSGTLRLKPKETVRIALTGTFTGRVVLEKSRGGSTWVQEPDGRFDGPVDTSRINNSNKDLFFRLRAKTLTSGSVGYTLADVSGDVLYQVSRYDSTPLLAIKDDGTLEVMGEEFSGGGGGGSPVDLTTLGDLISHDGVDYVRVAMGADGTFLAANSGGGLTWATPDYSNSFTIMQPDYGTAPVATGATDTLTFTCADGSVIIEGDSSLDSLDFTVDPGAGALAAALALLAPLTSPAFLTSSRFNYATASRVAVFDSNKDLVASSVTLTELGLLSGLTSVGDIGGSLGATADRLVGTSGTGGKTIQAYSNIGLSSTGIDINTASAFLTFGNGGSTGFYRSGTTLNIYGGGTNLQILSSDITWNGSTFTLGTAAVGTFTLQANSLKNLTIDAGGQSAASGVAPTLKLAGGAAVSGIKGGVARLIGGEDFSAGGGGDVELVPGPSASGARGSVLLGLPSIATNANSGHSYIPANTGAPSGTPTSVTGMVAIYYDSTGNDFYVYNGAWKKVTLT